MAKNETQQVENENRQVENENQQIENETRQMEYDPWKDMRQVFVPKMSRSEQDTLQVGVNDKTYFVPKNKLVDVPAPVAEVINEMLKRREIMEKDAKKRSGVHEMAIG